MSSTDPLGTGATPASPASTPAPPPAPNRMRGRIALAASASLLAAGLVAGGAAVAIRSSGSPQPSAYQSPTTTTEQLPFTGGQRRFGTSYGWTPPDGSQTEGGDPSGEESTSDATAAQSAGIVEITSTLTSGKAAGTGMVLRSDGVVVTNHHVVEGATSIKVTVPSTGETYTARYVGGDAARDIAVLKLSDASGMTTVDLDEDGVDAGDAITSVGDANGDGGALTAAPGTVRAEDQSITVQGDDGTSSRLTGLIELDADLVPGDSGGAVLDGDGQVVGMNVAASSNSPAVTGYAIPIAVVSKVAGQILDGDQGEGIDLGYHGYLGIGLSPETTDPVVVSTVDGGAADDAGIAVGDTITSLDGTAIRTGDQLRALLADLDPGDRATISWTTGNGAKHSATVTLGQAPVA